MAPPQGRAAPGLERPGQGGAIERWKSDPHMRNTLLPREPGVIMRALRHVTRLLFGLCMLAGWASASAQPWPSAKPITIIVPVPPGPSVDMIARLVAPKMSE